MHLSFGVLVAQIDAFDAAPDSAAVLGQLGPRVEHQLEEREEGKELLTVALAELGIDVGVLDVPLVHGPDPVWSALQSQGHPVW
jgi:hypothetical protein